MIQASQAVFAPALTISALSAAQLDLVKEHFDRLDSDSLSARFGMTVTRPFLDGYAQRLAAQHSILIGAFHGLQLLGLAELHGICQADAKAVRATDLELAMTVEKHCQSMGIGTMLAKRAIAMAAAWKADQVHACFEQRNLRMRRIASRLRMTLQAESHFLIASLAVSAMGPAHMHQVH
jgi:GNAT superfamily N-acetyltransferase